MSEEQQNLTKSTLGGLSWTIGGVFFNTILKFIIIAVLSRLLDPQDFGIVAASLVVVDFSLIFANLGVGPALVQRSTLNDGHIKTGFLVSFSLGIIVSGIVYFIAPLVANIFEIEKLKLVLEIMSFIFLLKGFSLVSKSLLKRELKFKEIAIIELISYAVGYGGVGIVLAFLGQGYWALVFAVICRNLFETILLFTAKNHAIGLRLHKKEMKELLSFGSQVTWAQISNYIANHVDYFIVGKFLGASVLGIYERTYKLMSMPATLFRQAVGKVLFPVLSKVKNDEERLLRGYKRGLSVTAIVVIPSSLLLIILAPEFISVLLGDKWLQIVTPFRIVLVGMYFRLTYGLSATVARAYGAVTGIAIRQTIYAIMVFIAAYIGYRFDMVGVIIGVVIALIIHFTFMNQLVLRITKFKFISFLKIYLPSLLTTLITGIIAYPIAILSRATVGYDVVTLLITLLMSFILVFLIILVIPRPLLGYEGQSFFYSLMSYLPDRGITRYIKSRLGTSKV